MGGDAALYADEEDVADMAGVMLALLSDDEKRRSLTEAGRARAAGFSWEATARATYELYSRLLE